MERIFLLIRVGITGGTVLVLYSFTGTGTGTHFTDPYKNFRKYATGLYLQKSLGSS